MRRIAWTLLLGSLLVGCGRAGAETPVLAVGSTPGKALATIWLSPTPPPSPFTPAEPTLTPAPTLPLPTLPAMQPTLPLGTAGPLQTPDATPATGTPSLPLDCSSLPPEPFTQVWQNNPAARDRLGCPTGFQQQRNAAYQVFEHGFMFWMETEDNIYVLSNTAIQQGQETDAWWRLMDTFSEDEPAVDESLTAPEGLLQPERGFGKVWRNNGFVREALGWATEEEQGYEATWLAFEHGWMITTPGVEPLFTIVIPEDDPSANTGVHLGPQVSFAIPAAPAEAP